MSRVGLDIKANAREYWPLAIILAIAIFFRFFDLEHLPAYINSPDPFDVALPALDLLHRSILPGYLEYTQTPETLGVYLDAISISLLGPTVFAIRLVTATASTIAVIGTYFLGRQVFKHNGGRQAAIFASAGLAFSAIEAHLSRSGYRAALQPPLQVFFLLCLWRGWQEGRKSWLFPSGLLLGLSLYTYPSSIALLGIVPLLIAHQFFFNRENLQQRVRPLLWLLLGFLIAISPLLLVELQRPGALTYRAQATTITNLPQFQEHPVQFLLEKWWLQVLMFGVEWKGYYNDLGEPLLPPFFFLGLLAGILVSLRNFRRVELGLLLPGLQLLLLPDLFSIEEPSLTAPYALRIIGVYSWAYLIAGLGLAWGWEKLEKMWQGGRWAIPILFFTGLAATGLAAYQRYFIIEAKHPSREDPYTIALRDGAISDYLLEAEGSVIVSAEAFGVPQVRYETSAHFPQIRSIFQSNGKILDLDLPADLSLLLTPDEASDPEDLAFYGVLLFQDTAYTLPGLPPQFLADAVTDANPRNILDARGNVVAFAYSIHSEEVISSIAAMPFEKQLALEKGIEFLGSTSTNFAPGRRLLLNLFWKASQPLSAIYKISLRLINESHALYRMQDEYPGGLYLYPTIYWRGDEVTPSGHRLRIPRRLPPGRYWIEVVLYDPVNLRPLPVISPPGQSLLLGPFEIP